MWNIIHLTFASAILRGSHATAQPIVDTSDCITDHMRKNVDVFEKNSSEGLSERRTIQSYVHSDNYRKTTLGLDVIRKRPLSPESQSKSGLRIVGTLSIDPKVRNAASKEGLTPSGNAVWLLVIAAREYAMTILKSSTEIKRSAILGKHSRVPLPRPHTLSYKPKPGEANKKLSTPKANAATRGSASAGPLRITAFDVHTMATQLPMGAATSLAGTVSRQSFETTLMNTVDSGVGLGVGVGFESLRHFVASRINAQVAQAASDTSRKIVTQEDRKSPHGGLGKGAKDLAALRARSSFISKSDGDSTTSEITGSQQERSARESTQSQQSLVSVKEQQPDAQPTDRRGKGSGVKNLKAMLARNKPGDH